MNPLDARESEETYEYPARPYTLPVRPVQTFRVLSESGDVPTAQSPNWTPEEYLEELDAYKRDLNPEAWYLTPDDEAWSDKYLTAEDARVLRQDGV